MFVQRYRIIGLLALTLIVPALASAQLVFQVCRETCPNPLTDPVGAAACAARISACEHKLTLYQGYMGQLGLGVTQFQLPALYRDVLQQFYPGVNLANWRFGLGDRQPPSNATTDCGVTYFNNASFVNSLRAGTLSSDNAYSWLFHELRHFGQCLTVGGRDAYAKMWFGQLETTFIQNNNLETLHDRMPMEGNAADVASNVFAATASFRDVNNRLVRPIAVALMNAAGQTLGTSYATTLRTTQTINARVTGGSDPLENTWSWQLPGSSVFALAPGNVINGGDGFRFTPTTAGSYVIRVRTRQPGSNLTPATRQVTVNVLPSITITR